MVMVRNIDFASTCEASLLPFHGTCHLAYLPREGNVLGLSKLARIVKAFARRLQSQPRFTEQVLHALAAGIGAQGAAVVVQARHLSDGPDATPRLTVSTSGEFRRKGAPCWLEFLTLLRLHGVAVGAQLEPAGQQPSAALAAPYGSTEDLRSLLQVSDTMAHAPASPGADSGGEEETLVIHDAAARAARGQLHPPPQTPPRVPGPEAYSATTCASCTGGLSSGCCGTRRCGANFNCMVGAMRQLVAEIGEDPSRQASTAPWALPLCPHPPLAPTPLEGARVAHMPRRLGVPGGR